MTKVSYIRLILKSKHQMIQNQHVRKSYGIVFGIDKLERRKNSWVPSWSSTKAKSINPYALDAHEKLGIFDERKLFKKITNLKCSRVVPIANRHRSTKIEHLVSKNSFHTHPIKLNFHLGMCSRIIRIKTYDYDDQNLWLRW